MCQLRISCGDRPPDSIHGAASVLSPGWCFLLRPSAHRWKLPSGDPTLPAWPTRCSPYRLTNVGFRRAPREAGVAAAELPGPGGQSGEGGAGSGSECPPASWGDTAFSSARADDRVQLCRPVPLTFCGHPRSGTEHVTEETAGPKIRLLPWCSGGGEGQALSYGDGDPIK